MKNKRLMLVFSILLIIVLFIVLSSTIFAVNDISLDFVTPSQTFAGSEQDIIDSADFTTGQSVFFINKNYYIKKLEKDYPYLNIISIESVFPNKLVIHAVERQTLACINIKGTYVVFDDEMFAMTTINSRVGDNQPILINANLDNLDYSFGSKITISKSKDKLISNILFCLQEWKLSFSSLKSYIGEITLDYQIENQILISMNSGLSIIIKDATHNLSDKMNLAFSYYDSNYQNCQTGGELLILKTTDSTIKGFYTPED